MIVPMKKATILCETKDAEATVRHLRSMGVIHVQHENPPEGKDISDLRASSALIDSTVEVLNQVDASKRDLQPQVKISGDWTAVAARIIELGRRREQLESLSEDLTGQIKEWERWGDVDLGQVQHLGENGVYLKLCQVPVKETGKFPDDMVVKKLFTEGNTDSCVVISLRQFECPFTEILPPKQTVSSLKEQLASTAEMIEAADREIVTSARFRDDLLRMKGELEKEIEFQQVMHGMGKQGPVVYVTGYFPSDGEEHLVSEARKQKWGIMVTEPPPEENVPTLLRNPSWVNLIKPVLGLLGLTPGYHELDISLPFLIFFCIFFGILIGDAGYGLVYILLTLLITIWLYRTMKLNAEMKTMVSLFYLLGSCAVIWGLLTGTFFGQGLLQPLVPQLTDPRTVETFCFFLGALHLSIAHTWRAVLKYPSLTALADVGYICILWTAFFLAQTLVLGEPFPAFGIWLVVTGIMLVILFTNPQRRVLRGIGEGVGTMALSFMNTITDVISYVRLFAVGLAGLAIAETTNTLASGIGTGIIALAAGFVILIIGHGLNIILGIISVLVHGVRLNVLEFSGHANVTWSGSAFEPFKE